MLFISSYNKLKKRALVHAKLHEEKAEMQWTSLVPDPRKPEVSEVACL